MKPAAESPFEFKHPASFRSASDFRDYLVNLDARVDLEVDVIANGPLAQPCEVDRSVCHGPASWRVGNRFAIQPMEGWDANEDGTPSDHTLRRWRRFGESGAKLIWGGEAFAVEGAGRANARQLCLIDDHKSEAGLASLLQGLREAHQKFVGSTDDLVVGLQLTHSGRFSKPKGDRLQPILARHCSLLDKKYDVDPTRPLASDDQLRKIRDRFVQAARLAWRVGFDFVDIKCCHGYLLHDLLGAFDRPGDFGGDFENRTRLFQEIVSAVRAECPQLPLAVRVSIGDLTPYGPAPDTRRGVPLILESQEDLLTGSPGFGVLQGDWQLDTGSDASRFLQLLCSLGIRLVNITLGSPYYCPHLQRPAAYPPSDGYLPPEDPSLSVIRHLLAVRIVKERFPELSLVGSGYSYLQQWLPNVGQYEVRQGHVDFVGLGRMALSYPEMPRHVLDGLTLDRKKICRTFSDCTTAPRNGFVSGCYPLDDYYKSLPQSEQIKELRRAAHRSASSS